jgi:hypothetical protein
MPMRPLAAAITLAATLPWLMAAGPAAPSAAATSEGLPGTLLMAGREVLTLQSVGAFNGEDRTVEVMRRIARVIEPENDQPNLYIEPFDPNRDVTVVQAQGKTVVRFKGEPVVTVTARDVTAAGVPAGQVAQMWADNLKAGLDALMAAGRTPDDKRILAQIQVAVAGRAVADGVNGVTESVVADRIRRDMAKDPLLRDSDLNVDVLSDRVIIRGEDTSDSRAIRRLETVIRSESPGRAIHRGDALGTDTTP